MKRYAKGRFGGVRLKRKIPIKAGDALLMLSILVISAVLFFVPVLSPDAEYAQIVMGESGEIRTVSLLHDRTYTVTSRGVSLSVRVDGGEIFVEHSDCRDGICKNTPPISHAGQSIICAPAGVVVRVVGEGADVDGVSG